MRLAPADQPAKPRSGLDVPEAGGVRRKWVRLMAVLTLAAALGSSSGQQPASSSLRDLLRQTTENEIRANNGGMKLMFKDHKETARGPQVNLMVETSEGTVGLL